MDKKYYLTTPDVINTKLKVESLSFEFKCFVDFGFGHFMFTLPVKFDDAENTPKYFSIP